MEALEISCQNCQAACCKGNLIINLTLEEASFMLRIGNKLITVAQPADYDRTDVIYPLGYEADYQGNVIEWYTNPENPNEPLAAGFGRYFLLGSCKYIQRSPEGWEHCGAYDQRPKVCRTFEIGSPKCLYFRNKNNQPVEFKGKV